MLYARNNNQLKSSQATSCHLVTQLWRWYVRFNSCLSIWSWFLCQVYNRCAEKRSIFGSHVIAVVDEFFLQAPYARYPKRIAHFANWAVEPHGPALWALPSPEGLSKGDLGYKVSLGTHVLEALVHTFLLATPWTFWVPICHWHHCIPSTINQRFCRRLQKTQGLPCVGCCCRTFLEFVRTTGSDWLELKVERAFTLWLSGHHVNSKTMFSCESVGGLVSDYILNTAKLSDNAWKQIQLAMGITNVENGPLMEDVIVVGAASLKLKHHKLFIPSSPACSGDVYS